MGGDGDGARHAGVRLVQAAYHGRSLSLYTKLGFDVREQLACMQGVRPRIKIPGRAVRAAAARDVGACCALCRRVHGFDRRVELEGGIAQGLATVAEHDGRISGYATQIGFFGHIVGETNDDLKALLCAAGEGSEGERILGPGLLLPTRNAEVFRWSLEQGLRVVQTMTLMSMGLYQEPRGAWAPSILF